MRSLPPFPVYSLAGAVGGGKGGGEDVSGDCGNAGALRAGVGGLLGALSTKVRVLLRTGGVEGHPFVIVYLANIIYSTPMTLACRYLALFSIPDGG